MKPIANPLYLLIVLLFVIFFFSCGSKKKENNSNLNNELTEGVLSADSEIIINAEAKIDEFYVLLKKSDYISCVNFFKEELYNNGGKDNLVKALEQRNIAMGKPDKYKFIYNYIDYFQNRDTVYYFILRVFNEKGGMCYEKYGLENIKNNYVIGRYEYSPVPYVDEKIANDSRSEINQILNKLYKAINSRDFEGIVKLADKSVVDNFGTDKLNEMMRTQLKDYLKINDFVVKTVSVEIVSGMIFIYINSEVEDIKKTLYNENIVLVDRLGSYYVANYKRNTKDKQPNSGELIVNEEQYGRFKKEVGLFYQYLSGNNVEAIMSKFDKSVFQNNEYNKIQDYISTRISTYGIPTNTEKTEHLVRSVSDFIVVDFYFTVSNQKGIQTYEKISIGYSEQSDFKLLGYEYSEKPIN